MKKTVSLILLGIVLSSGHCRKDRDCPDNSHNGLDIKNNWNRKINYAFYWNYPDTNINENYSPLYYSFQPIEVGNTISRGAGIGGCWEAEFMRKPKEYIYFFDEDSLERILWDTIKATGRGILERREITLEYLQMNNFTITYP